MKKTLAVVCVLLILMLFGLYFFVPATKTETFTMTVPCKDVAALRQMVDQKKWQKWWPGKQQGPNVFEFKHCTYTIDKILLNGFEATAQSGSDSAKIYLQVSSDTNDTAQFIWTTVSYFAVNPVKKIRQYFSSNALTGNVRDLAIQLKNYFGNERNIYGMEVAQKKVADSSLIALRRTLPHYPTVPEVYRLIDSIRTYIKANGGEEANPPMLNVHQDGPNNFEIMVAVPTKKDVPAAGKFLLKKMVLGNVLMGEIRGGAYTINRDEHELTNYLFDHEKTSPAIPYQSLVTDRREEKDTTKWITRLYYPVF